MEEEKQNLKKCYNCGYYKPYYQKGDMQFTKLDVGGCRCKRETVDKRNTCERWICASYRGRVFSKIDTQKALHKILFSLCEIKQIIEEDKSENAEN